MDYEKLRKIIHAFGFISLAYYLLPVGDFYRQIMAMSAVAVVLLFEFLRMAMGVDIPLFRNYEKNSLSGFGWCSIGLLTSFLLFPAWVNIPVVFAWSWVDPFMGYYRKKKWMIPSAFLLYTLIFYGVSYLTLEYVPLGFSVLFIGPAIAVVGVYSEILGKKEGLRWLNDDFTMILFPALAYYIILALIGI